MSKHIWSEENGEDVLRIDRPTNAWAPLLHEQLEAAVPGFPFRIDWPLLDQKSPEEEQEWPGILIIRVAYDTPLSDEQHAAVVVVVENHDGTQAMQEFELKKVRAEQILADNQALVDSARAKRLAGETLTNQELAAIADLFMFQGFQPQ
jgi:hypothetical protein